MKTQILFFSCLFWCVFHSSSIPFGGGCENVCTSNDSNCWELCLSSPSFAKACGKINACNKIRKMDPNNPNCKGVPTKCGETVPETPKPVGCGKVKACQKLRKQNPNHPSCKGVPTTCGSDPSPPTNRTGTQSGECKCLPKELKGPGNLPVGHCLTRDPANDKFYCYVDRNNGCQDSKPSRRLPDLIYSYQACVNQRNTGVAAPNKIRCSDDDEQCWLASLSSTASSENCRDDDEQCWLASLSSPASSENCRDDDEQCWLALFGSPAQSGSAGFSCKSVDCGCSNDDIDCHIDCLNCIIP